jgi:hypothetical protein
MTAPNFNASRVMASLEEQLQTNRDEIAKREEDAAARVARVGRMIQAAYGGPTTAQEDAAWARVRAGEVNREPVELPDDLREAFAAANRQFVRLAIAGAIAFGLGWLAGVGF